MSICRIAYCYMELSMDSLLHRSNVYLKCIMQYSEPWNWMVTLAESNLALANLRIFSEWNFKAASDLYQKALKINPNNPEGNRLYAYYLMYTGNLEDAYKHTTIAYDLDPFSLMGNWEVAWIFIFSQQYGKGMEMGKRLIQMEPAFFGGHYIVGSVLMFEKDMMKQSRCWKWL